MDIAKYILTCVLLYGLIPYIGNIGQLYCHIGVFFWLYSLIRYVYCARIRIRIRFHQLIISYNRLVYCIWICRRDPHASLVWCHVMMGCVICYTTPYITPVQTSFLLPWLRWGLYCSFILRWVGESYQSENEPYLFSTLLPYKHTHYRPYW